jgi:hypothetical protein
MALTHALDASPQTRPFAILLGFEATQKSAKEEKTPAADSLVD